MSIPLKIPFVNFKRRYAQLQAELEPAVLEVLASGSYILGEYVERFEKALADYFGHPYVLAVANGTDALIMALKALGIGAGDEVIVPANSFIASAGSVLAVGAKPVFCDIGDDLNLDVADCAKRITHRTKALFPVHLTGRPADMTAVMKLAKAHGLKVVEDAAQSIGATHQGQMTGFIGDIGCFSLHPLKNLHVYGDGGLITVRDEKLYRQFKLMRNHGLRDRDTCETFGLNSRLDSLQAQIGWVGLKHLPAWTERRRYITSLYRQHLHELVRVPVDALGDYSVYHNCVIQTPKRDALMAFLLARGIESKVHYPIPLHLQPASAHLGCQQGDFPMVERMAREMLSLPVYPELTDQEVEQVIQAVQQFFAQGGV